MLVAINIKNTTIFEPVILTGFCTGILMVLQIQRLMCDWFKMRIMSRCRRRCVILKCFFLSYIYRIYMYIIYICIYIIYMCIYIIYVYVYIFGQSDLITNILNQWTLYDWFKFSSRTWRHCLHLLLHYTQWQQLNSPRLQYFLILKNYELKLRIFLMIVCSIQKFTLLILN